MSPTPTDRFALDRFDEGERWKQSGTTAGSGDPDGHNDTVQLFDELGIERGPIADRPTSGTYDDEFYHAVDQRTLWRWDAGTSDWIAEAGLGTDTAPIPGTSHFESMSTERVDNTNYNETVQTFSGSGTFDVDLSLGNVVSVAATGNVTITFSNITTDPAGNSLLIYFEDDDGTGPHSISWPTSVVWDGGSAVAEIPGSGDIEVSLLTDDGGTEWRGRQGGQNFA